MDARRILVVAIALIGWIAVEALGGPSASTPALAGPGCSLADLSGTYAYVVHGTNPLGEPFGSIGTFTADGAGNLAGFRVAVDNGEYGTAAFTCTYAMSPDCFFRGPCVDDGEVVAEVQLDGVLTDGKKEAKLVLSGIPDGAGGPVVTGEARRQ